MGHVLSAFSPSSDMSRSGRIFTIAGAYGLVATLPFLFSYPSTLPAQGFDVPAAFTAPSFYYPLAAGIVAFQVLFLVIGSNPTKYRSLMALSVFEKWTYVAAMYALFGLGRAPVMIAAFATVDLGIGGLFLYAFRNTPKQIEDKKKAK